MTHLLAALLGRLPIGWLQLTHNKGRLFAAIMGVAFANVLVFMQLGFLGALSEGIVKIYEAMDADIVLSATDMTTLAASSNVPRRFLLEALTVEGVQAAAPLYIGRLHWDRDDGITTALTVYGVDPSHPLLEGVAERQLDLQLLDVALIDEATRQLPPAWVESIRGGEPLRFETSGRTLSIVDTIRIGAGFEGDGYLVVSDQTFFQLFPTRGSGAPNHIFLQVEDGASPQRVLRSVRSTLGESELLIRTLKETQDADQLYQTTKRPTGIVFGFGVVIGVLVGIVIVYQVLSTDVADHLSEYATFKAMGYRQRFFLSIVLEEAVILAILGFIPGIIVSMLLYRGVVAATFLPVQMNLGRALVVFVGTVVMCALSGALATRRLAAADPAELF